jgi:hypothetical protein
MDASKLREVLLTALPPDKIMELARALGVVERESMIAIDELVNALVLTSRTPAGGRQADVLRAYVKATKPTRGEPVRGTFYARFNDEFESLLERLLRDSIRATQADPVLLPPSLQGVKDWVAIDSETVQLHPSLMATYRGTGDYAAVKVHKAYSLGRHNMIDFELSPAREHDSSRFPVTEDLRGFGLLMDLGYAGHERLMDCQRHGVSFVIKLKTGWKARLTSVDVGEVNKLFEGTDFAEALSFGQLACENGFIDADVALNRGAYSLRLVAVQTPEKGLCVFLTNLPREHYSPAVVGDLYRLRWEIEKSNKLDKSDFSLADLDCRKVCSARTMIYASLLGSSIIGRLVHADHCALVAANQPLRRGPIHARLLAMALAAFHTTITAALTEKAPAGPVWDDLARKLAHLSRDPNWRRRPSVLDTLLGLSAPPGRPRRQKATETGTSR